MNPMALAADSKAPSQLANSFSMTLDEIESTSVYNICLFDWMLVSNSSLKSFFCKKWYVLSPRGSCTWAIFQPVLLGSSREPRYIHVLLTISELI